MIARAREREIDLEMKMKRQQNQAQVLGGSSKRPKLFDLKSRAYQGWSRCSKCGKTHDYACRVGGFGCFKCGPTGDISKDCAATTTTTTLVSNLICFHCNQRGNNKANCPSLLAVGPVVTPDPVTL